MDIRVEPRKLSGTVRVPASKSAVHRMLICAALAEGVSRISGVDFSKDITATMSALEALGADFQVEGKEITVTGIGGKASAKETPAVIDCCESGSTLRFLIPVAAALGVTSSFHGQGRLPKRPITTYIRELTKNGIAFDYEEGTMPFVMSGQLQAGVYELEGDVSSQYVTGLLLALPLLEGDSEIRMLSPLQSKPYADMTIACMKKYGLSVIESSEGNGVYYVKGGQMPKACDADAEGDYSQAAFFYVANALGSSIQLENLTSDSVQGDKKIVEITEQLCYNKENGLPVCFDVDATDIPDLVPILAVLGTFGSAPSRITGAERLKIKESDRLAAISAMLNTLGGNVIVHEDGLEIYPVTALSGGEIDSFGDHRIAMCAAIAATRCTGDVIIRHGECIEKSYPEFYHDYNQLGGNANVIVME